MTYLGDFRVTKTIRKMWNSNAIAGESITRATNGTISVYKDGGTTQSTTGVTDTEDFDSLTGVHLVAIDTSADGTFYSAGSDFEVVLSAATIDGKTINATLFSFSLENRSHLMPTTDGRKLDVSAGGEAGVDWANIGSPTTTVNLSGTTVKDATDVNADTDSLLARITTTRAAYLDNLSGGAVALASGVNVTQISNDSTPADNLKDALTGIGGVTITAALTGNITGNLSGSVGSVTGNVGGNVTGTIGGLTAAALKDFFDTDSTTTYASAVAGSVVKEMVDNVASGSGLDAAGVRAAIGLASANLDTQLGDLPTNSELSTALAAGVVVSTNNDKTGYRLSSAGVDDILDEAVEGSRTVRQYLRGMAAALLAKLSGAETTTVVIRDVDDTKDRITATVDADGNRSAVTIDLS